MVTHLCFRHTIHTIHVIQNTHLNVFSSKTLYSTLFKFHINVLNIKEHERQETGDRRQKQRKDRQTDRQIGGNRDKETVREGDRDKDRNLRLRLRKSQR